MHWNTHMDVYDIRIHVSVAQKFVAPIKESRCVCVMRSSYGKKGRMVLLKRGAM
jgi:hypothetical protein